MIETEQKLDNLKTRALTPEERAEQEQYQNELNNRLYGESGLVSDDQAIGSATVPAGERFQTVGLNGHTLNTDEIYKSSTALNSNLNRAEWSDTVGGGLPIDRLRVEEDVSDIHGTASQALESLGVNNGQPTVEETAARTVGEHIDRNLTEGIQNERLDKEGFEEVKNAMVGRRYMEGYANQEQEIFAKLPAPVAEKLMTMIYSTQEKYGSFEAVPNDELANIGEMAILASIEATNGQNEEDPSVVYVDRGGELAIKNASEAIQEIESGNREPIDAINDPDLKEEINKYVDVLEVYYKSGVAQADPHEREQLKKYLQKAFSTKQTIE